MDHVDYTYTVGMTPGEIAERLQAERTGVLSLADGDEAYAVPVGYHYDGSTLLLRLGEEGEGRKGRFVDRTDRACLVVYDDDPPGESWSVVAAGPLRELTDAEHERFDDADVNERFLPLRVFREAIDEVEVRLYELEIEELTGRRTTGAE